MSGPFPIGPLMLEMGPFKNDFIPAPLATGAPALAEWALVCFVKYMPGRLYPCRLRLVGLTTFFGPRKSELFLALLFIDCAY